MSMQQLMMALMGNQGPKRSFKDSIVQEPTEAERFGKHFEGEPWPYRKSGQRVKLQDDPTIDPADPNDQERKFNSGRLNMNEREPSSRGKNNFFESDESEYSDADDSDILDYPRIFKTHHEPEYDEDFTPFHAALDTVNAMRDIRKRGNLGILSPYNPSHDTRRDAAEYERLGKSLIQQVTSIPIKNRQEFDILSAGLFDPSSMDSTAEGVLNGAEKIISDNLRIAQSKAKKESKGSKKGTQKKEAETPNKPPITSFFK